jgi:hypothetical protein
MTVDTVKMGARAISPTIRIKLKNLKFKNLFWTMIRFILKKILLIQISRAIFLNKILIEGEKKKSPRKILILVQIIVKICLV